MSQPSHRLIQPSAVAGLVLLQLALPVVAGRSQSVLNLAARTSQTTTQPDWEVLWTRGERVPSVDLLTAHVASLPLEERGTFRDTLIQRELAIHRYASALERMGPPPNTGDSDRFGNERGIALHRLGRFEAALPHLTANNELHALMRVDALEALNRREEWSRAIDMAVELLGKQHLEARSLLGQRAQFEENTQAAIQHFESCLELDPTHAPALFGLGRALVRRAQPGDRERGLALLQRHREVQPLLDEVDYAYRGVDLAPLHAPNHAAVADLERALGRFALAQASYEQALKFAKTDELVPIALRAARFWSESQAAPAKGADLLESALKRKPDARLWVRAGDLSLEANDKTRAQRCYRQALTLRPKDTQIQARLRNASK